LASAITAWLSAPKEFRFLENLIYGAIRHSSLFVETEFILLAQAIESLHRLTDSSRVVAPTFFEQVLKGLCELISKECGSSPIAKRFLDSIRHANEPAFQNRIESLLSRITGDHAAKLLGDLTVFAQTLKQTRNHFTHPGISKKSKVLTGAKELFRFNQKLHAFLRLLMLMRLGFSEENVFEPVYNQSRQWT
jgi:crotonobetainyl-CoA:carnitine CoA-transferase CaiB-like acyl-CoA transferase